MVQKHQHQHSQKHIHKRFPFDKDNPLNQAEPYNKNPNTFSKIKET